MMGCLSCVSNSPSTPIPVLVFGSPEIKNLIDLLTKQQRVQRGKRTEHPCCVSYQIDIKLNYGYSIPLELWLILWPDDFDPRSAFHQNTFKKYFQLTTKAIAFFDQSLPDSWLYAQSWLRGFQLAHHPTTSLEIYLVELHHHRKRQPQKLSYETLLNRVYPRTYFVCAKSTSLFTTTPNLDVLLEHLVGNLGQSYLIKPTKDPIKDRPSLLDRFKALFYKVYSLLHI